MRLNVSSTAKQTIWIWALMLASAISLTFASPTKAFAKDSPELRECRAALTEATEVASIALDNAETAEHLTEDAQEREEDAKSQRDDYREQRDRARTERDREAQGHADFKEQVIALDAKYLQLVTKSTLVEARLAQIKKHVWYALGAGVLLGGTVIGIFAWKISR